MVQKNKSHTTYVMLHCKCYQRMHVKINIFAKEKPICIFIITFPRKKKKAADMNELVSEKCNSE